MAALGGEKRLAGGGMSLSHPGSHTAGGTLDALPYQSVNSLLQLNRLLCVCSIGSPSGCAPSPHR